MAVKLNSTSTVSTDGVKFLVYGAAGSGKTRLIATLPEPVILSAEGGLLSLADSQIPFIAIDSLPAMAEAYLWLVESDEAKKFKSVAIDSLSEIAETCLNAEKKVAKDPRQAYGAMSDQIGEYVRKFRDLPGRNVYMSAKLDRAQDETGRMLYAPSMPGIKTGLALPYYYDEVLALRVETGEDGTVNRALMTTTDGLWTAKDRSGKLAQWEPSDLGKIIAKITGKGARK